MSREYADPKCPQCHGHGFLYGESMLDGGRYCECTLDNQRLDNMERVWKSLREAKEIPGLRLRPPLKDLTTRNLWITAPLATFRAHLKAVAYNKSILWDARVFSDKDLVGAWLNTARAQGHKIYDTEIENVVIHAMDIDELVEPPDLVVLFLGVKQAPNKETPNVLLEALGARRHIGRPTWIVDQPDQPIDQMHHRAYSETLEGILSHWPHIGLAGPSVKILGGPTEDAAPDPVANTDVDEILADGETDEAGGDIDQALADLGEEEEAIEEEFEEEEEEVEEEPAGLLSTLKVESEEKPKGRKRKWRKKS